MGDFVKHGKTDLRTQFFETWKIFAQRLGEDRDFIRKQGGSRADRSGNGTPW
jgi:histidyl-tRNA synthetase